MAHAVSRQSPNQFGKRKETTVDESGTVEFSDVPPGRTMLQAGHGTQLSDLVFVELPGGTTVDVTVALRSQLDPATLDVSVLRPNGKPDAGVEVHVKNMLAGTFDEQATTGRQRAVTTTNATGHAWLNGLQPGHYWVWSKASSGSSTPSWVAVPAGRTTEVVLHGGGL